MRIFFPNQAYRSNVLCRRRIPAEDSSSFTLCSAIPSRPIPSLTSSNPTSQVSKDDNIVDNVRADGDNIDLVVCNVVVVVGVVMVPFAIVDAVAVLDVFVVFPVVDVAVVFRRC